MAEILNETKVPRKKERTEVENFLKDLKDLSVEEKLKILAKKFAILLEENRTTNAKNSSLERQIQLLQREKDQIKAENGKILLARSRFEELSRELQRQNKLVKEESMSRVREEEEKRKEVSNKFQSTLSEVSALLETNHQKNNQLREENREMAVKLESLCANYAMREKHLSQLEKQYDLESQLNEAKLAQAKIETAEIKEKLLQEKQKLLMDLNEYQKKYLKLKMEEETVRQNLSVYQEKYNDFQKVVNASNDTFSGFKNQMAQLTKKIKILEKETKNWKQRYDKSNGALIELIEEKKIRDIELINATKKCGKVVVVT